MRKTIYLPLFSLSLLLLSNIAQAQERLLAYSEQSATLTKGNFEVYAGYDRKNGGTQYYNGNYGKVGFRMGVANYLSVAAFLNGSKVAYVANQISPYDRKTRQFDAYITDETEVFGTLSAKIMLLDGTTQPLGVALSNELSVGTHHFSFSPKFILDKKFGDNYLSFNAAMVFHTMREALKVETITTPNAYAVSNYSANGSMSFLMPQYAFNLAYLRYFFDENLALGVEVKTHSESQIDVGTAYFALFAGPTVSVRRDNWLLNVTALPQIKNLHKTWVAPDNLVLDAQQRVQLRASIGIMF
ncbi:MAG: hypothetical protein U5L45_02750 [Saprospiraceae bacterium]|nr:hypothetical protein [Saprospiraceae bacterium]